MGRNTITLETARNTITQEYLDQFTSEYGITEDLHPELPGPDDNISDFRKGKVGIYTHFFDFANYRIPISQLLFDILGWYQIHLSQLSVIGAAKASHFEISCRILNIIPTLNLFRVFYLPHYSAGWMGFKKRPDKNQVYFEPFDSLKNWNNRFFWIDERIFLTPVDWRAGASTDHMPPPGSYSTANVETLNQNRTEIQQLLEELLCLVGLSRRYYDGDDYYPIFLDDRGQAMDLINLVRHPKPMKVDTGLRPRNADEVPLLLATTNRVIPLAAPGAASSSATTPSAIEKSPLDFTDEDTSPLLTGNESGEQQAGPSQEIPTTEEVVANETTIELNLEQEVAHMAAVPKRKRSIGSPSAVEANTPKKQLRADHPAYPSRPSMFGGKSMNVLTAKVGGATTLDVATSSQAVSDADPLSYAEPLEQPTTSILK
ncbi:hypothetical protein Tco_0941238 [Tanacetum coccineum]|uniref:Transposase (Putative), gypsy type n=1 Tax=Tanacetum coccineum TaxID=301880 RepID=A0ABQ5DRU7_9ASTR